MAVGIVVFGLLLGTKLYFVQIVHGESFSNLAEDQYVEESDIFDRGTIYFEDKDGERIAAATLAGGYILAVNPSSVTDPEGTYESLQKYVELPESEFVKRASRVDDPYEEVAKGLSEADKKEIESLDLEGVDLYREYWRFYPGGDMAAQTLGFVAFNEDSREGRYGLERFYENTLSRESESLYINFFAEVFSQVGTVFSSDSSKKEGDLILSLEPSVQKMLEDTISDIKTDWGSERTAGIIMDPKTGEVYAMAEDPSFDLNEFGEVSDISLYSNTLVERVYEMGSIIKPLTVAAGLDAGVITPQTTYEDRGSVVLDGRKISNYDGKARGVVPMQEVLNQSLNTGATNVMLRLGTKRFGDYFRNYGLGEKTGIDLPGETPGLIDNLESPREIEYATASFGQGIALSPVGVTRALASLANGGLLVTPHVVKEVEYTAGFDQNKESELHPPKRILKAETSEEITRMLVEVVDEALLGGTVALPDHSIAAKTGTAQISSPDGGYYNDRFLHSFFGYFPAFEPRFLIFLLNVEPKGARFASETLTHPFMDLTKFLIQYYEVPPDR